MALYEFEDFTLDTRTHELRQSHSPVFLRSQPGRALTHLVEHHGRIVSREELQAVLWPDGVHVHFEYGVNSCIRQVRTALKDTHARPRFIETLVRLGYRFVAPVGSVTDCLADTAAPRFRLRILPVRPLGSDPALRPFAQGLGEELVSLATASVPRDVLVLASPRRPASGGAASPAEGVADLLVAAAVRSGKNRLRVTARIIDARRRVHVWAGSDDVTVTSDPLEAQTIVAKHLVAQLLAIVGNRGTENTSCR